MLQSIYEDVKQTFRSGHMVNKIILVNVGVWLVINLIFVFSQHTGAGSFYQQMINHLAIPSEISEFITRPWTILTHMFLHKGFWHIVWNMILFYWFGRIVGDLIGDSKILPLYIYGGLFGAAIFMLTMSGSLAMGASAAVMSIVIAAAIIAPDYIMRLILIGDVKIKYIALTIVFLDIIGTAGNVNTGGHFAHLGGALFGYGFVVLLRNGIDLSESFNNVWNRVLNFMAVKRKTPKSSLKVRYKSKEIHSSRAHQKSDDSQSFQEKLDRILEKIKDQGYENLTDQEKEFLYQASKK